MSSGAGGSHGERVARVHGKQSNRKTKERGESKTVYKSVLDNPFDVKWPMISPDVQNAILARVIELMQGVAEFNIDRQKQSRATKREKRTKRKKGADTDGTDTTGKRAEAGPPSKTPPEILQQVTVGINEVTRRLEELCKIPRQSLASTSDAGGSRGCDSNEDGDAIQTIDGIPEVPTPDVRDPVRVVLVCRSDIDPALLVSHIPYLVAACNTNAAHVPPEMHLKLVTLPKGAEYSLAQAMGLRRIAVMALHDTLSKDDTLATLLSSVPLVAAHWLIGPADLPPHSTLKATSTALPKRTTVPRRHLEPTHIKQLRTTAPKDMRAAKAQRAKGRADAKAKRKARAGSKKGAGASARARADQPKAEVV
ncbi:hypothetical protein M0805_009242 [Coniferiporia weirii]|nr:hypothetical protein M0805_009242 [Coniferiporia weirii]